MITVKPIIINTIRVFFKILDDPNILIPNKHVHITYNVTAVTV